MEIFKVLVWMSPVMKVVGLSQLQPTEQEKVITDIKQKFNISYEERILDTYIGYEKVIKLKKISRQEAHRLDRERIHMRNSRR